ncbi:hypothetical protein CPB86DRAFT_812654 [Serendipita vermifera]|nr:hypothetical protein CPB86DRAFT_812654 [Serendipita vermifera]
MTGSTFKTTGECLGIYKATYAYTAQGEDELSMEEDQLVFLMDNSDDDWHKIRIKPESQDLEGPDGLVPAAYIEKAEPISKVKAAYDYEANAQGEISMTDGQLLNVFERDEDWILVEAENQGKYFVGYVPANYVEEADASTEEPSPAPARTVSAVIVPDSPPRPAYMAPEERTAAAHASADMAKQDPIETWSVSQLDKKGKKKKGTLGVGNGAIFFASESDKTPVQKWQTADITTVSVDKSKNIQIDFSSGESLRFHSKDAVDAINKKVKASRIVSGSISDSIETPRPSTDSRAIMSPNTPRAVELASASKSSETTKSVHFASVPENIPPRPDTPEEEEEEGPETAVVLYDFTGDADDELSVKEGETLWVIDRSNDDWWKCRNNKGKEGVVPAQYVDLETMDGGQEHKQAPGKAVREPSPEPDTVDEPSDDSADERERREEEERRAKEAKERERRERERARAEREEAERKAREEEEERIAKERKRAEEKKARAAAAARQQKAEQEAEQAERRRRSEDKREKRSRKQEKDVADDSGSEGGSLEDEARRIATMKRVNKDNERQGRPSSGVSRQGPPPTGKTRIWHDRTGQFRVEAEFKGYENGKIRLHKLNGVIIEVPSEKMSAEDMKYVAKVTGTDAGRSSRSKDDDDVPLSNIAKSTPTSSSRSEPSPVQKKRVDWFKFFLDAGCDMDDCTRYDQAFTRDKIDESILPDMKTETLRALGLREGDIIRVMKAIEKRHWVARTKNEEPGVSDQIQADEQYARQVQQAILTGGKIPPAPGPIPIKKPSSPAPNLFAGPNGTLKDNTRRGRPTPNPARSASINVDENKLASATTQLGASPTTATTSSARTPSPNLIDTGSTPSSAISKPSGFDDDAWTPRPSSTNPISPVVAVTPPVTSASAPPESAPKTTPAAPTVPTIATPEAPARPSTTSPTTAALSAELELLQKIAELKRPPSAPVASFKPAAPPIPSPSLAVQTTQTISPPTMMTLQAQQTGIYNPTSPFASGVRGPFAPVPANEAVLLKPLVPTNTGMVGFVPTRPTNGAMAPQPLLSQQTGFQMQPTSVQVQPTGFQPTPSLVPQATGFGGLSPMVAQPTGLPYGFRATPSPIPTVPPVPSLPPQFTAAPAFGAQPNFNSQPTFNMQPMASPSGAMNFGASPTASPPPPDHSPANVFASMKSGNFGGQDHAAPAAPNYDAMRSAPGVNPLLPQPTGWVPGMQQGFQYR